MSKPHTIRCKMTRLMLGMVLTAMALAGAVGVCALSGMRNIMEESSRGLGEGAAGDAEKALEEMAIENLRAVSGERAAYIEEKFTEVERYVHGIAAQAQMIYEHPENYPDRETALPVKGSDELAAQLLWSERLAARDNAEGMPSGTEEIWKLGNLQDMLVQYNANSDMVSSAYLATISGWMIQADYIAYSKYTEAGDRPDFYEAGDRQWYRRALIAGEGETVYSDVIRDIHQGRDCIVCAQPVYLDGETVAVAGVGSYLDTVEEAVLRTTIGESGYAFLVDQEGKVVISPKTEGETKASAKDLRNGENAGLAELAAGMAAGESGAGRLTVDGREVYLAYAPLGNPGWSFVTVMDVEEVIEPAAGMEQRILKNTREVSKAQEQAARKALFFFILTAMAAASMTVPVSMLSAGRITEPVRRLTKDVAEIDGEHLGHRVFIRTGDEIEALGHSFNRMREQLEDYIGKLAAVTAEKERIRTEIQVASRLQADMLPDAAGAFADKTEFMLDASMTPAKGVGGDFYDFFLLDRDHLALVMADVSGKGVPAALFMVAARTLIRIGISACRGNAKEGALAEAMAEVNGSLCGNNKNDMFVTAWVGILNLSTGVLRFVNAGHCPPVILKKEGSCAYEKRMGGFVLAGMEGSGYREYGLTLQAGDTLFLYTDGVTEASDRERRLFGEERLLRTAQRASGNVPTDFLRRIWADIQVFQGEEEQFDDITMLALQYSGGRHREKTGKPQIEHTGEFAGFVRESLSQFGIPRKTAARMEIAFDELFSNICRYSGAGKVSVEVGVQTPERGKREAVLSFEDDGVPFNPLECPEPDIKEPIRRRKEGGLGIYLVKRQMDRLEYQYSGGKNRLKAAIIF